MDELTIKESTRIVVGRGLPDDLVPPRSGRSRVAVLTQPAVTDRAVEISQRLEADGLSSEVIGLPDRDEAKTLDVAKSVYEALARFGLTREDTILGVGGGAAPSA